MAMKVTNTRQQLTDQDFGSAMAAVLAKVNFRREQKGDHTLASSHEILGILDEEYDELRTEVHCNMHDNQVDELEDIAVAAIFGIASIKSGGIDW